MGGLRLGVLVSGSGSNLQSIIDATESGVLKSKVVCVLSNKESAYALERGRNHGIDAIYINPKDPCYDDILLNYMKEYKVDLIVLAGYLKIVDKKLIDLYKGRIINIHPSLLPKYGGKGYYGIHVHEAVLKAGEKESGATVHYVDDGIDTGEIILQRSLKVREDDTPQTLQKRILEEIEHKILVEAIKMLEEQIEV